jgi:hypothetical protein
MDLNRLNPEQLAQFQSLVNQTLQIRPLTTTGNAVVQVYPPQPLSTINSPSQIGDADRSLTTPSDPPPITGPMNPIGPYHSMRPTAQVPQGHATSVAASDPPPITGPTYPIGPGPYHSMRPTAQVPQGHATSVAASVPSTSQPFLGLDRLGLSMTGQVNQRRLASAAATLPRQPQLPRRGRGRGRGRGPAISAPSLRRVSRPKIEDCMSTIPDAQGNFPIRIKVKVYPPQVSHTVTCSLQLNY